MQWLPTVLLTALIVVAAIWCALCVRDCLRVRAELRELTELAVRVDRLGAQLRKLSGRFYVSRREDRADDDLHQERRTVPDDGSGRRLDVGTQYPNGSPCEHWSLAQLEGPQSAHARCECEYCESMRRARAAVKAALVPRGAEAVARFTEENQHG